MERIDIDKLVIRLRHVEPQLARKAVEGLGYEVLHTLAAREAHRLNEHLQVHRVDLGVLPCSKDSNASGLRHQIGLAVSNAIQTKRVSGEGE
ncbi:MAG: hypothetical protein P8Z42_15465 [Anaerolineales bacterium]|jgi:hypothetical protein